MVGRRLSPFMDDYKNLSNVMKNASIFELCIHINTYIITFLEIIYELTEMYK